MFIFVFIPGERKSLYEMFLKSMFHFQDDIEPEVTDDRVQTLSNSTPASKDPIYQMLHDQPDALLAINMDSLFVTPVHNKKWQDHHNVRKM